MARGQGNKKAQLSKVACKRLQRIAAAAGAATFAAGSAGAIEVTLPKVAPSISLQIPEGWVASYTSAGLELVSPEKNSLIIANVVVREEKAVAAWARITRKRMIELGAIFDPSNPMRVRMEHDAPTNGLTNDPSGRTFSFSGSPLLDRMPGMDAPADRPTRGQAISNPFEVVQTAGARLGGKIVDTEISYYALPRGRVLAVEQQSGLADGRAVAIINSLKMLP